MINHQTPPTFLELDQQRAVLKTELEKLDRLAQEAQVRERDDALAKAQSLIDSFGFTNAELRLTAAKKAPKKSTSKGTQRPVKFYDPLTGTAWSGIGNKPQCMRGKDMDDFALTKMSVEIQNQFSAVVSSRAVEVAHG